ncbi:MAG: hypothetical protein IPO21_07065 [Bacteroidales bacterium]|nr:hypothetical protein [Bacteroidales bacterium]
MSTKIFAALLLFFAFSFTLKSQNGFFNVDNLKLPKKYETIQFHNVTQDLQGRLYFASDLGIHIYDGTQWTDIDIEFPVIGFAGGEDVFFYTATNFGKLQYSNNEFTYQFWVSDTSKQIKSIVELDDNIYIQWENEILLLSKNDKNYRKKIKINDSKTLLDKLFLVDKSVFCLVKNKGIYRVEADSILPIGISALSTSQIVAVAPNKDEVYIATTQGNVYSFDGNKVTKVSYRDESELGLAGVSSIASFSDSTIAIATKSKGIWIYSTNNGTIQSVIDVNTGLKSNEIQTIFMDVNLNVWICHEAGLSKTSLLFPFRNYSSYPGLCGDIHNVLYADSALFVATSEGVFELKQTKLPSITRKNFTHQIIKADQNAFYESTVRLKHDYEVFFENDGNNLTKKRIQIITHITLDSIEETGYNFELFSKNEHTINQYIKNNYSWYFSNIQGIEGICTQLLSTPNGLLIATSEGLYLKDNNSLKKIEKIDNCKQIYLDDSILVALTDSKLLLLNVSDFSVLSQLSLSGGVVNFTNEMNTIWVAKTGGLFKVDIGNDNSFSEIKEYKLQNGFYKRIFVVNNSATFICGDAVFGYDSTLDSIVKIATLPMNCVDQPEVYSFNNETILSKSCLGFKVVGKSRENDAIENQLNYFEFVTCLSPVNKQQFCITTTDKVFIFTQTLVSNSQPIAKLTINLNTPISEIISKQQLDFSLSAQTYLGERKTLYRYRIIGVSDNWSSWSENVQYSLSNLASGKYTIEAEAYIPQSKVIRTESVSINIPTNYLSNCWIFLLLSIVIFIIIVVMFMLKVRNYKEDNNLLIERINELENKNIKSNKDV